MLGLDNAGKTTIVKKFCNRDITAISPTLGFEITPLQFKGFTINLWDVGGQRVLRAYWKNYFESTDGLIWVVDSNDTDRLETCKEKLRELLKEEKLYGASLLLLLNKQDIEGSKTKEEIAEILDVKQIVSGRRHAHLECCSAVTGDGLLSGMNWLIDDIKKNLFV